MEKTGRCVIENPTSLMLCLYEVYTMNVFQGDNADLLLMSKEVVLCIQQTVLKNSHVSIS
jgi:hypothetical protein